MTGLHEQITLSFMLPGHTKFSPDLYFGLLKHRFRRSVVSCLDDMVATVEASSQYNTAQLVAYKDGTRFVQFYDWKTFLGSHFKKIRGIKEYHHFNITSNCPGSVCVKLYADSEEERMQLLKDNWEPTFETPEVIPPPGLTAERQWYLYESICQYCTAGTKDKVCPFPSVPKPGTTRHVSPSPASTSQLPQPSVLQPPVPQPPVLQPPVLQPPVP